MRCVSSFPFPSSVPIVSSPTRGDSTPDYTDAQIEGILGGNFRRVLTEIWTEHGMTVLTVQACYVAAELYGGVSATLDALRIP